MNIHLVQNSLNATFSQSQKVAICQDLVYNYDHGSKILPWSHFGISYQKYLLYTQIGFADGWLGMCYHRPNGRIQGLFQAMAYQSGNIYRNDSISLFRCGLMLCYTCMYIIILDLCLNLLIWTPLVTNILALWVLVVVEWH